MRLLRAGLLLFLCSLSTGGLSWAQEIDRPRAAHRSLEGSVGGGTELLPDLRSEAAVLYDFETGTLLFSKNADRPIPPASMTKLMTLHLVYRAIDAGRIARDQEVLIDGGGDFRSQAPGSSLMFLEKGQQVTVLELMRGLAVPSGNDAAVVLARLVGGSQEAFVDEMNREADRLGFEEMHFADPSGLSDASRVTARSFGRFCIFYIRSHPEALRELHSIGTYTYPTGEALAAGASAEYGPISQENYNVLVGRHPWVDGLKTGYIEEAGYNIALTAETQGRRLVAVLLGGPGKNSREGALTRAVDGTNLLSYGFYSFRRVEPVFPGVRSLPIWKGARDSFSAAGFSLPPMVLEAGKAGSLRFDYELQGLLAAPVVRGQRIGTVRLMAGGELLESFPLRAGETVPQGDWTAVLGDSMLLFLRKVLPMSCEDEIPSGSLWAVPE